MKKILFTTVLLAVLSANGNAQLWKMRRYEVSGGIGTTQFFGDIGGYSQDENLLGLKDISFKHTRFNINSSFKYRVLRDVSVRVSMTFGSFHSTDERGSNENRRFESKTLFFEPALIGEYYIIKNKGERNFQLMKGSSYPFPERFFPMLDLYVFTGFGQSPIANCQLLFANFFLGAGHGAQGMEHGARTKFNRIRVRERALFFLETGARHGAT